jgi:hypothetical protein
MLKNILLPSLGLKGKIGRKVAEEDSKLLWQVANFCWFSVWLTFLA